MGKRTILGLVAAVFLCLGLVGCAAAAGSGAASPVGVWGSGDAGQPSLEFTDDGTVHGTDGCNLLGGGWTQAGETVTFSALTSTEMYCEGVDDWLRGAASATISGTTMTIEDAAGSLIGTLERAEN